MILGFEEFRYSYLEKKNIVDSKNGKVGLA